MKQHQSEVNELRDERLACNAKLHLSQQAATRNSGKAIVNSSPPTYDQEPTMVAEDDEMSMEKEIDKLMALISLSFKKSTNLPTTTSEFHQTPVEKINTILQGLIEALEEAGIQLSVEQVDRRDDTDDEPDDQELEAHYLYMAQIQEVTPDTAENFGPIFDVEPLQKVIFGGTRYRDVNYASKVAIDCAKAKGDLMSYKIEYEKSFNKYTRKINDLNQTISEKKKELVAHQETISIMSQEKKARKKFHKTREDKELEKVIALENKIKVLDNIVYKTGQSVQNMNMLNRNCKTSVVIPEFLKKAQRANPRLYDIGCYNDNIALMLAPESDEMIRLAQ
ncbi:hypothetical protein Tco_0912970, partial [Tanacetum coccineum]